MTNIQTIYLLMQSLEVWSEYITIIWNCNWYVGLMSKFSQFYRMRTNCKSVFLLYCKICKNAHPRFWSPTDYTYILQITELLYTPRVKKNVPLAILCLLKNQLIFGHQIFTTSTGSNLTSTCPISF